MLSHTLTTAADVADVLALLLYIDHRRTLTTVADVLALLLYIDHHHTLTTSDHLCRAVYRR